MQHGKNILYRIENSTLLQAVRNGLVMIVPVLMIGSAALIARSLPITAYQAFIAGFANGILLSLFNFIYNGTFGMLSIYITISISLCLMRLRHARNSYIYGAPLTSLACYFILVGVLGGEFSLGSLGVKGMFTSVFCALTGSYAYDFLASRLRRPRGIYTDGADVEFNEMLSAMLPAAIVVTAFALFNYAVTALSGQPDFQQLFMNALNGLFFPMGRTFLSGLIFVLTSSLLWFFGIHGSDVLEGVMEQLFLPAGAQNAAALLAGNQPTEVLTKPFFDIFVLIGGCGSALCLLLALLLFSKRRSDRHLAHLAAFPMLFNINELMIFGLPVILNPILLIPFLLTPLVCYIISYLAMSSGLVPLTGSTVEWTTPVLLGGYAATGSIRGALLQLVNVVCGVFIYKPFVKLYVRERDKLALHRLDELVARLKHSEENNENITLTELGDDCGNVAKALAADLHIAMDTKETKLFYQPQFDVSGACIGSEALMRWEHPTYGRIYPPLIIKLADESGLLTELEKRILDKALTDMQVVEREVGHRMHICVNVTVKSIASPDFEDTLRLMKEKYALAPGDVCLEITEQMALKSGADEELFASIRNMGYRMAIDDFAMGHTSVKYLQGNQFDLVKLDGSLVTAMQDNPRSKEIITYIIKLAQHLHFDVLAEYVETSEQQKQLEAIGCKWYQGYLYSPAVPLDEYILKLKAPFLS